MDDVVERVLSSPWTLLGTIVFAVTVLRFLLKPKWVYIPLLWVFAGLSVLGGLALLIEGDWGGLVGLVFALGAGLWAWDAAKTPPTDGDPPDPEEAAELAVDLTKKDEPDIDL